MGFDVTVFDVEIELEEKMLGTVPKNKEVYATYIAAKGKEILAKEAAKRKAVPHASGIDSDGEGGVDGEAAAAVATLVDEEVETVQDLEERAWTGFHKDQDGYFLYDYAVKGFLCEAGRTLKESGLVKQIQDKCKRYLFVKPRKIRLPVEGKLDVLERPLRALTPLGPRTTVVRSDVIPEGTKIAFQLHLLKGGGLTKGIIEEILSYGQYIGIGQWRTASWGRFAVLKFQEVKKARKAKEPEEAEEVEGAEEEE
jgi:hypothetical protein